MSESPSNETALKDYLYSLRSFLLVRAHQYMTEVLKIEALINNPQSLYGRKETTTE